MQIQLRQAPGISLKSSVPHLRDTIPVQNRIAQNANFFDI